LVVVDYVSKWVEAMPSLCASIEHSIEMMRGVIFPRYCVLRVVIIDRVSHFIGDILTIFLIIQVGN